VHKLAREKVDFKINLALKRQNSYTNDLDDLVGLNINEKIQHNMANLRRSTQIDRTNNSHLVKDITPYEYKKMLMDGDDDAKNAATAMARR